MTILVSSFAIAVKSPRFAKRFANTEGMGYAYPGGGVLLDLAAIESRSMTGLWTFAKLS